MSDATYEKKNHLAILTMNRPEAMNAMSAAMRKIMSDAYVDFRDDKDSWVLIITCAGEKAFSAGMDLKEMSSRLAAGPQAGALMQQQPNLISGTIDIWKPIIAAMNGVAVGGG